MVANYNSRVLECGHLNMLGLLTRWQIWISFFRFQVSETHTALFRVHFSVHLKAFCVNCWG